MFSEGSGKMGGKRGPQVELPYSDFTLEEAKAHRYVQVILPVTLGDIVSV